MTLQQLVADLDEYLFIDDYDDRSNNGLQIEGRPEVWRVGLAVDAAQATFEQAVEANVDLLLVHHGLFWGAPLMVTGSHRRRLATLLAADISLYAAHLPLDGHPEVGNNAVMAQMLGLEVQGGFGYSRERPIGLVAAVPGGATVEQLRQRLSNVFATPAEAWPFRDRLHRVGLVTGKATSLVSEAVALGLDGLICGEMEHMVYHAAREAGLAVILGGHYQTETVGVKALGGWLEERYSLETVWLDAPTGL